MIGNTNGNPASYGANPVAFRLVQGALRTSISISGGNNVTIISGQALSNIYSSFVINNIDGIADDKVVGIIFLWSNGSQCVATDTLVSGGSITMALRNLASTAVTISSLRIGIIYEL